MEIIKIEEINETVIPAISVILIIGRIPATNNGYNGKKTIKLAASPTDVYQFFAIYKKCGASQKLQEFKMYWKKD